MAAEHNPAAGPVAALNSESPRTGRVEVVAGAVAGPRAVAGYVGWEAERSIADVRGARRDRSLWGCMRIGSLWIGGKGIVGVGFGRTRGGEDVVAG